jgi:hypothetical protein
MHGVTSALVSRAILREPQLLAAAQQAPELPGDLCHWLHERAAHAAQQGRSRRQSAPRRR